MGAVSGRDHRCGVREGELFAKTGVPSREPLGWPPLPRGATGRGGHVFLQQRGIPDRAAHG